MPGSCRQYNFLAVIAQDYVIDTGHAQHLITASRRAQAMCSIEKLATAASPSGQLAA
jgi:hypothetical protein